MVSTTRASIEWHCQQLALRFIAHSDRQEWGAMCELLTEDASFARPTDPDNPILGRDAIRQAFESRPADRITRHLCTNVVITVETPEEARGSLYALLYTGQAGQGAEVGLAADPRQLVGEFEDRYRLTEDGWRIAARTGRIVFSAT